MNKKITKSKQTISLLDSNTPFAIRESFTQLRTNLMYSFSGDHSCPIVGITSIHESAGKSTVITNLAISFAQMGKKVLLVDADMRCPTVCRYFNTDPQAPGLSELISGIQENVIQADVVPNLDLISSGHIPPNPAELLASENAKKIIAGWRKHYDFVFMDFPPMELISDALIVASELDGYIFTVRSGRNKNAKEIKAAIESMEQVNARILGIVLAAYNIKGIGYGYNNRYGKYGKYSSKYGKYGKYGASQYANSQSSYEQSYVKQKSKSDQT